MNRSDFFNDVYEVVRAIPPGRVTSYGAIAAFLGAARSARMVGYALNASLHENTPVPAHRVVNRNGLLTGKHFFSSPDEMEILLRAEGISVTNDRVNHFQKIFWDPAKELLP